MALKVWLKLNGNLKNSGLKKMSFTNVDAAHTSYDSSNGVYDGSYTNNSFVSGGVISNETISLGQKHSMFCWFRFKTLNNNSSLGAGLVTQHRYENNRGTGITIKYVSSTTGYLSVNTGNGSSRTYNTYCGTTLLQANIWYHGGFTYDGQYIRIYVNGVCEKVQEYPNMSVADDNIALFCWSLKNNSSVPHPNYKLNGNLDDVRIYDNCLTDYDVERIYNNNTKMLQVCLPFHKDNRNVGLENVKTTSGGTFQIVSDTTSFKCAKFGTSTGYVKIPHDIFKKNTEMSMTFSINFNSWNTAWATPIGIFKNSNAWTGNTFTFLRNNTGQTFAFSVSNGTTSTQVNLKTGNLSLSKWYHFACVYKDRIMSLYQDGTLLGTYTPAFDPSLTAATLAIVGASTTGGSYQTDCKMSNVRFYNLALTEEDVKRISKALPGEYQPINFLKFAPGQRINTGVLISSNNAVTTNAVMYYETGGTGRDLMGWSTSAANYWGVTAGGAWEKAIATYSDITKESNVTYSYTAASVTNGQYQIGALSNTYSVRTKYIKSFQIIVNGTVQRDYYACYRKSDKKYGMYDIITRTFYTNAGSGGDFTGI